jgi:hypothetical protein
VLEKHEKNLHHEIQKGKMSFEVIDVSTDGGSQFALTMRIANGRTLHTNGRLVLTDEPDGTSLRSFKFDSDEFHREVMMGNIDIRAVCAKLEQFLNLLKREGINFSQGYRYGNYR